MEARSHFLVLCSCASPVRSYIADVCLLALLIVGRTEVISGLVGLVSCGSGLNGVVRYCNVRLSNSSSMLLMCVSLSDRISCYCPIPVEARLLPSWWGFLPGQPCITVICYLINYSFVPVYVLMSPRTCRCVLLVRNVVPIPSICFCVHPWWMVILSS